MDSVSNARSPVKKMKQLFARITDRGNQGVAAAKKTARKAGNLPIVQQLTFTESQDMRSPPRTPTNAAISTLGDLFGSYDTPSPPRGKHDMLLKDVHDELRPIYPDYHALKVSSDPYENEKYMKLVYAVGKGMFTYMLHNNNNSAAIREVELQMAQVVASDIVDLQSPAGKRFHVMYSTYDECDRTMTIESNMTSQSPIRQYEYYVGKSRLPFIEEFRELFPGRVYELFLDSAHPNLEPYYRVQHQGNCFAHAGIALHFYLQLFHNANKNIEEAMAVDLSRFIRNQYEGRKMYEYIINNTGAPFESVLDKLIINLNQNLLEDQGCMSFDKTVEMLKTYGPAIVSMSVGKDFSNRNQWRYKGKRPDYAETEVEGHGMLLVGIVKSGEDEQLCAGKDVYFILQNFWEDKQFVMVRRDYFLQCTHAGGEPPSFHWVTSTPPEFADPSTIYAKPAGKSRVSLSSQHLERPLNCDKVQLDKSYVDPNLPSRH